MSNNLPSIAWFLPAHNEAENLPSVVSSIHLYLSARHCPFTITIVNDGSTDATAGIAEDLSEQYYPEVRVVHHAINQGYGAALRTGLKTSLETGHDLIGFCDADGQFVIDSLGPMLTAIDSADVVLGYRLKRADGVKRLLMGRGWHYASRLILRYQARDVDCGFKLFTRRVVSQIMPQLSGEFASVSPELIARAQHTGFGMAEVSVEHRPRRAGEQSGASLRVIFGSFRNLWQIRQLLRNEA